MRHTREHESVRFAPCGETRSPAFGLQPAANQRSNIGSKIGKKQSLAAEYGVIPEG
jgi:hypothetical protein